MKIAILTLFLLFFGFNANAATSIEPYRLAAGDQVEISAWRDENLTRTFDIPPDGKISFPLIGDITAAGLTVAELRSKMVEKLLPFVPDSPVSVLLISPKSLIAFVVGKVNKPGQYSISPNTTVIQALAMAGGPTPFAATKEVLILRNKGDTTVPLHFSYDEVAQGKRLDQNITLERGDVVVVP